MRCIKIGAKEVAVDIGFQTVDFDALEQIHTSNLFWVGQHWDSHISKIINSKLDALFTDGMTQPQLAKALAHGLADVVDKSSAYWHMLADHTATKTREMGRVTGYQRAGIQYVKVQAYLDDKTSAVCRELHGTIIPVTQLTQQRHRYLAATNNKDADAAKSAWKMFSTTTPVDHSAGSPPYHFNCRTITVAYQPTGGGHWQPEQTTTAATNPVASFTNSSDPKLYEREGTKVREGIFNSKMRNGKTFLDGLADVQNSQDFATAGQVYIGEFQEQLLTRLAAVRSVNNVALMKGNGKGAKLVREASQRYPDDWTDKANKLGELSAVYSSRRASYNPGLKRIKLRNHHSGVHEYGHHLQRGVPELDAVFQNVHRQRTKGDSLERLRGVTGNLEYKLHEVTRRDNYYDPYVGRVYPYGGAQEVMTMSFDKLLGRIGAGSTLREKFVARYDTKLFFDFIRIDQPLFDTALGLLFTYKP